MKIRKQIENSSENVDTLTLQDTFILTISDSIRSKKIELVTLVSNYWHHWSRVAGAGLSCALCSKQIVAVR